MKKWFKENLLNIAISGVIAIPLSFYVTSQHPEQQILSLQSNTYEETTNEGKFKIDPQPEIAIEELPEVLVQEVLYYDVPLSYELQDFIFAECERKNIAPEIIIAMIERESTYNAALIGDGGDSIGLMQIQPKWHKERMKRLGCTDLLNPYENIKVGIDIAAELKEQNSDLYWVLMAYNGGQSYANKRIASGNISDYALYVVEIASELAKSIEN